MLKRFRTVKRTLYIILAAVLFLTACTTGDGVQQSSIQRAVAFVANMPGEGETTRAANVIDNTDALKQKTGFGVFGCYTGLHKYLDSNVHPDFMYNEHVSWGKWEDDTDDWGYSPLKYWPNGEGETYASLITGENPHYVSFMAYAPYTSSTSSCIYRFSKQGDKGDPWLEYRLAPIVDNQVDLLYALPLLDEKKRTNGERLLFTFNHALACVGDRISINLCEEYISGLLGNLEKQPSATSIEVLINNVSVEYTLTEEGRLVLWNDKADPNWHPVTDGTPITTRKLSWTVEPSQQIYYYDKSTLTGTPTDWVKTGEGVFYIPKQFGTTPQTVKLTVNYTVIINGQNKAQNGYEISTTFKLSDYPKGYQAGKHLYIEAHICSEVEQPELTGLLIDGMLMGKKDWGENTQDHSVYNW